MGMSMSLHPAITFLQPCLNIDINIKSKNPYTTYFDENKKEL